MFNINFTFFMNKGTLEARKQNEASKEDSNKVAKLIRSKPVGSSIRKVKEQMYCIEPRLGKTALKEHKNKPYSNYKKEPSKC